MPPKPLTIGSLNFAKKGDAYAFVQSILHRYDVGDKVGADDEQILRDTLALHPEANAKVGCGITHFSVRSADFGTKCFWVNRPDGTTEKFSFKACITG